MMQMKKITCGRYHSHHLRQIDIAGKSLCIIFNCIFFHLNIFLLLRYFANQMYLGSQQPQNTVLQLTGQLTIQLSPPQDPKPPQQSSFSRNPEKQHQQHSRWDQLKQLQKRIETMENKLARNVEIINLNGIEELNHIKKDAIYQIQKFGNEWKRQSQLQLRNQRQEIEQFHTKLKTTEKQIKKDLQTMLERMVEKEKMEIQRIHSEKIQQVSKELEKHQLNLEEKMKFREQKLQKYVKMEVEKQIMNRKENIQKLEESLNLRIIQERNRVDVLTNKVNEIQEQAPHLKDKITQIVTEMHPQGMVDTTESWMKNFVIRGWNIYLEKQIARGWQQVMLNVLIKKTRTFTLRTHIKKHASGLAIGIVDRITQKNQQSSRKSGNAICYYDCSGGAIFYGTGQKGIYKEEKKSGRIKNDMDVVMKVDMEECALTFTFIHDQVKQQYQVNSDLLKQDNRQFVPYYEFYCKKDSIDWFIE